MSQQQSSQVTAPPKFKDGEGRTWSVKLTYALADRILEATEVDLIPDNIDTSPITALLFQNRKLAAVLWECIAEQAGRLDPPVEKSKFKEALDGDTFFDGWRAVVDAIVFFIQKRSAGTAKAFEEAINKQLEVVEQGATLMVRTLHSEQTSKSLTEAADQIAQEMQADLTRGLAGSATKSQR